MKTNRNHQIATPMLIVHNSERRVFFLQLQVRFLYLFRTTCYTLSLQSLPPICFLMEQTQTSLRETHL